MIKITTTPDKKLAEEIREKIKANGGHCACAIVFDDSSMCMCKEFRNQIERGESGECHCGLYNVEITQD